jgi:hypothetical protein
MFEFLRKKKSTPVDLSVLKEYQDRHTRPKLGAYGPSAPLDGVPVAGLNRHATDPLTHWRKLDEETAWNILAKKRMADMFPWCKRDDSPISEFELYWELIRRSPLRFRKEIFVGLRATPETPAPLFVPRSTFESHSYILGESNRGKTSQAVATLLYQLAVPETDPDKKQPGERTSTKPPAIIIFDLKPQGDPFLHAFATLLAHRRSEQLGRNQPLRFFSNYSGYDSLQFDPWSTIASEPDLKARAGIIYKALSLIHPESQEAVFFMNEQRYTLEEAMTLKDKDRKLPPLTSLRNLAKRLKELTRKKGGEREARGVHGALSAIIGEANVIVDEPPQDRTNVLDFDSLFENGEVLYVHLESDDKDPSSKAVGKFMFACLLAAAKRRRRLHRQAEDRAFVSIDEFQRLAAHNIVSYLETARDAGVSVILSHQSPESLMSGSVDLFSLIFDNTSFQQYLSLTNDRVIKRLELVSGRVSEFLRTGSASEANSVSHTDGESWGEQESLSLIPDFFGWAIDRGTVAVDYRRSTSTTVGHAKSSSAGWHEVKIRGLTPENIARINNSDMHSLVFVRGREPSTLSPLRGLPTIAERIFPFTWDQAESLRDMPWPLRKAEPPKEELRQERSPEPPEPEPSVGEEEEERNIIAKGLFDEADPAAVRTKKKAVAANAKPGKPKPSRKGPKKTKGP